MCRWDKVHDLIALKCEDFAAIFVIENIIYCNVVRVVSCEQKNRFKVSLLYAREEKSDDDDRVKSG